jgi:hypothetical protein
MTPRRDTANLTLERLSRRSDGKPPLVIGLERPVTTLKEPVVKTWPRVSLDTTISAALVLLAVLCLAGEQIFDRPPAITIATLPAEQPITIVKPETLKVEPVDEAMLGMIAPALQPAGGAGPTVGPGVDIVITNDPAFAEVKVASLKDLEALARDEPGNVQQQLKLGAAYAEQGAYEKASVAYARAYDLDPNSARNAFNLAITLEHLGRTRQAVYYYGKVMDDLGLNPGAPENADVPVDTVRQRLVYLTR